MGNGCGPSSWVPHAQAVTKTTASIHMTHPRVRRKATFPGDALDRQFQIALSGLHPRAAPTQPLRALCYSDHLRVRRRSRRPHPAGVCIAPRPIASPVVKAPILALPWTADVFTTPRSTPADPLAMAGAATTIKFPEIPRTTRGVAATNPLARNTITKNGTSAPMLLAASGSPSWASSEFAIPTTVENMAAMTMG